MPYRAFVLSTRWIDQGAVAAIKLAKTPNRHIAGIIETFLKQHVADKTNWQAMLKNEFDDNIDLLAEKNRLAALLNQELKKHLDEDNSITTIEYPGKYSLGKIQNCSFDKTNLMEGKLIGIKGQYLIFENETVLNIRKHNGYYINFKLKN